MHPRVRVRGLIAVVTALVISVPLGLGAPRQAAVAAVDMTCPLAVVKSDPHTVNVLYPDEGAVYFGLVYTAVPSTRLRVTGQFPRSRYMSWNFYDPQLRPFVAMADEEIRPDRGSVNPFLPGARRDTTKRSYTLFIEFTPRPAKPAPNTVYVGEDENGQRRPGGGLLYRVYAPDRGLGDRGGVPVPRVTWEPSGSAPLPALPKAPCGELDRPTLAATNDVVAGSDGIEALDPVQPWGLPSAPFRKFLNLPTSFADFFTSPPPANGVREGLDPLEAAGGSGGFLSNVHNTYVASVVNRAYGKVLHVRFKAPTTPRTFQGPKRMPQRTQLRYWSLCHNEFFTQRFIDCQYDEQSVVDRRGWVHFVVSTPANRPKEARPRCGVNWLAWGPDAEGVLIVRHMLADRRFAGSIKRATYGQEAKTMGGYLPRARYYADAKAFHRSGIGSC